MGFRFQEKSPLAIGLPTYKGGKGACFSRKGAVFECGENEIFSSVLDSIREPSKKKKKKTFRKHSRSIAKGDSSSSREGGVAELLEFGEESSAEKTRLFAVSH